MMVTEYEALKQEFLRVSPTSLPVGWRPLVATCRVSKLKDDTLNAVILCCGD